jgi:hypothetical protein
MPTSNRTKLIKSLDIPGPGQYDTIAKLDGPAFSLRGRIQTEDIKLNPGPGNYNPCYEFTIEKPPAFKLGTSKRIVFSEGFKIVPGPGNYEIRNSYTGPSFHFGSGKRSALANSFNPGPGTYGFKPATTAISFSMTPRRPIQDFTDKTPGPGTYSLLPFKESPTFSLGKSTRKGMAHETISPGPGAYSPELPKFHGKNVCNLKIDSA